MFSYRTYLIFLAVSVVVSIGIQLIVPPPYGLIVVLALFVAFPLMLRYMSRARGGGAMGGMGGGFFGLGQRQRGTEVRYVCLVCENRYKGGSCPRCGSKMKRADF